MEDHKIFLEEEIRRFIGDLGIAKAGIRFLKNKNNRGILQANNKSLNEVKAALALVEMHNIRTVRVSGVLNKLVEAM